jgi:two-component system, NtrC family, nitrogen regulation sensor histidine kinase NtrY
LLILAGAYVGIFFYLKGQSLIQGILFSLIMIFLVINLISYANTTNRKITRFLESIRYSDFSSSFTKDSTLGKSFREMNLSFNEVIDAFKKTGRKRRTNAFLKDYDPTYQYRNHLFDSKGKIGVINGAAKQLLQIPQFKDINDLGKLSS